MSVCVYVKDEKGQELTIVLSSSFHRIYGPSFPVHRNVLEMFQESTVTGLNFRKKYLEFLLSLK